MTNTLNKCGLRWGSYIVDWGRGPSLKTALDAHLSAWQLVLMAPATGDMKPADNNGDLGIKAIAPIDSRPRRPSDYHETWKLVLGAS